MLTMILRCPPRQTIRRVLAARAALTVLVLGMGLTGCQRGADSGATPNPNAPGSPGTGNAPVTAAPQQPDARAGGSTGGAGVGPPPEASGGDLPQGASGGGRIGATPGTRSPAPAESTASLPTAGQGHAQRTPGSRY